MQFGLGPEVVTSYKRLSYTVWYALAEFIDNSTQAYLKNRELLDELYKSEGTNLSIRIEMGKDENGEFLSIVDNSIGMDEDELQNAVIVGKPPQDTSGRSKYGLGMKTSAFWFGNKWRVETKKLNEDYSIAVNLDVEKIAANNLDLKTDIDAADPNSHYTKIIIRNLNRRVWGRTLRKTRDFLRSFYRKDITEYNLDIICFGEKLVWDYDDIFNRLLKNASDELVKKSIDIEVNGKKVSGWAGVFEKGSRRDAGFSILQSNRVITGWPNAYRPETLFGAQEGGVNDLVNQRLVGELFMDGFDVSHTKDEILMSDEERDELEAKLLDELNDYRQLALSYRKYISDERVVEEDFIENALSQFEQELESNEVSDFLETYEIPTPELTKKINESILKSVMGKIRPSLKVKINSLTILVYIVEDMSPNDPYLLVESTTSSQNVIVLINKAHPHWKELTNYTSVYNFIRDCVYDGVAEWKTYFKLGTIYPDTVKLIKDNLLRIPFEIEKHSALNN